MRKIRELLYAQTSDLASKIANSVLAGDMQSQKLYLESLEKLYVAHKSSPDPFLTETLADFTEDNQSAIDLYSQAIEQSLGYENEPLGTKYLARARRQLEIGRTTQAQSDLILAMDAAKSESDPETVREAMALINGLQT